MAGTKAARGTDRDDVATSLFVQGYVFRIATVAIGSWVLADAVIDVDAGDDGDRPRPRPTERGAPLAGDDAWRRRPTSTPSTRR